MAKKKTVKVSKKKIYKSKPGSRVSDKDAALVGAEIESLIKKMGNITPEDVVRHASSSRSKLHKFFDWDDSEAANKWRLQQARQLMASVVEVVVIEGKKESVRSFHNVKVSSDERAYVPVMEVLNTPPYAQQLIGEAVNYIDYLNKTLRLLGKNLK